jgi:hypothetical protein
MGGLSSPFQHIDIIDIDGITVPVKGNHQSQPNGSFRRSHRHDEEHENLSVKILQVVRQGNKRQVNRVQHQFDAHEDDNGIPPCQDAVGPHGKQDGGNTHVVINANHYMSPVIRSA